MSPETRAILDVRGVCVSYGAGRARRQVLEDVSLAVLPGEAVGVIGESGSGKTTLARTVLGLVAPSAGEVHITGEEVTGYSSRQWRAFRRKGAVQYMFQDPLRSLDPDLSVFESIAEPLQIRGAHSQSALCTQVHALAERLALDERLLGRLPSELSGGQRQRVALARALITEPALLILDEPISALDAANRVQVLDILRNLRATGVALLFISHDLGSVAALSDRILVLYRGSVVETGETDAIVHRPEHPYTKLLVGSAASLTRHPMSRERRSALRAELTRGARALPR